MNRNERIRQETEERGLLVIPTKWAAYKAIRAGGVYAMRDKKLYKAVKPRLKRMFTNPALIDRFILLK